MINLLEDDIKIAGEHPSDDIKKNRNNNYNSAEMERETENGNIERAKKFGQTIANEVIRSVNMFVSDEEQSKNAELRLQRGILLTFTAVAGIERICKSQMLSNVAKSSFYQVLSEEAQELYRCMVDTGAFSFYYLAFRRGIEVDRRIGQTFAMLCS
ncbi:MAG: hypothetical protein PHV07_06640, partial [Oscillospiraceae bacterium]|nr:hypothetical protein [Oscillospiraceae bacterium]